MILQSEKTKYAGKCNKCNRELKVGWSIFYDTKNKKTYCKPCGEQIQNTVEQLTNNDNDSLELLVNQVAGDIKLINAMVASYGDRLIDIEKKIDKLLIVKKPAKVSS